MKQMVAIVGLVLVCATGALMTTVGASGAVKAGAACVPGVKKINGVSARTFCGPAKATVKMNGKTFSYSGGECSKGAGLFAVNIGTIVLGKLKNKPEYFGVAAAHAGTSRSIIGTVAIKVGLKGGTFSGKVFGSSTVISGSFTC